MTYTALLKSFKILSDSGYLIHLNHVKDVKAFIETKQNKQKKPQQKQKSGIDNDKMINDLMGLKWGLWFFIDKII